MGAAAAGDRPASINFASFSGEAAMKPETLEGFYEKYQRTSSMRHTLGREELHEVLLLSFVGLFRRAL